ncbi:MAG TPA: hypothetical protein DIS88_12235 [Prevotella sp.]|nr:hypothetical protein [Prevotella sp.]
MVFEPIIRLSDVAFIVDVFIGFPLLIIGGIYMFVAQRRDKTFFSKMFDEKKNIYDHGRLILVLLGMGICLIYAPADWKFWAFLMVLELIDLMTPKKWRRKWRQKIRQL